MKRLAQKDEDGYSFVEIVVALGILILMSAVGFFGHQLILGNSKKTAADSAVANVYTQALVHKNDTNSETTPFGAAEQYYNSRDESDRINILIPKGDNEDLITMIAIVDNYAVDGYFYYTYRSEESPERAKQIVEDRIESCKASGECVNTSAPVRGM